MTSGTRTLDTRVYGPTGCGNGYSGAYTQKMWSGQDDPEKTRENPYFSILESYMNPRMEYQYGKDWFGGTVETCFGVPAYTQLTSNQIDLLRTRVLKGVLGKYKQHDFNGAIFLGELPETVSMVSDPIVRTLRAYALVRKGKVRKAEKVLFGEGKKTIDRKAADKWLALRYGWIPLISDAYNAADAYNSRVKSKPVTELRVRSKAKSLRAPEGGLRFRNQLAWTSFAVVLKAKFDKPYVQSLGFDNPALLAWELLPFSFVVDWAYDVGSWLELVTTLPRGSGATYIETRFDYEQAIGSPVSVPGGYAIRNADSYYRKFVRVERKVSSYPFVPPPRLKNPFGSSLKRFGDMVALARALT